MAMHSASVENARNDKEYMISKIPCTQPVTPWVSPSQVLRNTTLGNHLLRYGLLRNSNCPQNNFTRKPTVRIQAQLPKVLHRDIVVEIHTKLVASALAPDRKCVVPTCTTTTKEQPRHSLPYASHTPVAPNSKPTHRMPRIECLCHLRDAWRKLQILQPNFKPLPEGRRMNGCIQL